MTASVFEEPDEERNSVVHDLIGEAFENAKSIEYANAALRIIPRVLPRGERAVGSCEPAGPSGPMLRETLEPSKSHTPLPLRIAYLAGSCYAMGT